MGPLPKIKTTYWAKPIPSRLYDWCAVTDDYDGADDAGWQPIGYGRTEQEAIEDLHMQIALEEGDDSERMMIVFDRGGWWIVFDDYDYSDGPFAEYEHAKRALDDYERAEAEDAEQQREQP